MNVKESRIRIHGVLDAVTAACDFVVNAATNAGLDENAVYHCRLAVDEAVTNIIEHGYGAGGVNRFIEIVCQITADFFTIVIVDDGAAFDPLTRPDPDPLAVLDDRQPGGWGIYFIKRFMDAVSYQRVDNRNHLSMSKHLR